MILTGDEIGLARERGEIVIEPFEPEQVNPNSYNFRLGGTLTVYTGTVIDPHQPNPHTQIAMPDEGYLLEPGRLYLGHTVEVLGGDHYVPTFAARSSVARLGLFIHLSAGLGDIGYTGQWTLQLYPIQPIRVYPGMCVGQMMWWQPHGTIDPYSGKYQHARGAQASRIHIDYRRLQQLPGLNESADAASVGGKFAALSRLYGRFPVPAAFVIPAAAFTDAITPTEREQLARAFADLHGTLGSDIDDACRTVADAADRVQVPPILADTIVQRLADLATGPDDGQVAIRSSAVGEDTTHASLAGIHQSVLGLSGSQEVIKAVEAVWRSYYAPPAVLARIRAGDFSHQPRMAVIVQRMITAHTSGVAFTRPPATVDIEHVDGSGEELMAGITASDRTTIHAGYALANPRRVPASEGPVGTAAMLRQVADMALHARAEFGHDVDMEWAHDGRQLWLLQCRPVTSAPMAYWQQSTPVARAVPLYGAAEPDSVRLGAVADIVAGYRRKRCPAFQIARRQGAHIPPGWILNVNGLGLRTPTTLDSLLAEMAAPQLVLDLGDGLRQQIISASELIPRLRDLILTSDGDTYVHAVIVRPFLIGDLGLLSHLAAGALTVETSTDGLLAMNRGQASTTAWSTTSPTDQPVSREHLDVIARTTAALNEQFGPVTAEWIRHHRRLYFIDYSAHTHRADASAAIGRISPGEATGPITVLDISDAELERLSVGAAISVSNGGATNAQWATSLIRQVTARGSKAIVVARRPYAALSVLIGHVAGFIFEDAATLCHLAILLRESSTPAAIHPNPSRTGYAHITGTDVIFTEPV